MNSILPKPRGRGSVRAIHEVEVGVTGAIAGAAMGAIGGPPGAIAGAVIGGVIGAIAGHSLENQHDDIENHEAVLDAEIGVSGGELGAPNLEHPEAILGACSVASSGGGGRTSEPAEGPIQSVD